jgi:hypothetical protein
LKNYKEFLEKIYELCENCKSKVKFEITKQDGMIKNYLLKIGKFDYFFEHKRFENSHVFNSLKATKIALLESQKNVYVYYILMAILFILTTLVLGFNEYKFDSLDVVINNKPKNMNGNFSQYLKIKKTKYSMFEHVFSQMNGTTILLRNSILDIIHKTNLYDISDISDNKINQYLNKHIPMYIISVYVISCFMIIINPNGFEKIKEAFLIWLFNMALIVLNFNSYVKFFSNEFKDSEIISFNYVLIFVPLIQFVILCKLNYVVMSMLHQYIFRIKFLNGSKRSGELENENDSNKSPDSSVKQKCFSTYSPNSYSFTKVLHSSTINSLPLEHKIAKTEVPSRARESSQFFLKNKAKSNINSRNPTTYELSNSIIKPALFSPSVDLQQDCFNLSKSKLKKNNSLHSSGKYIFMNIRINRSIKENKLFFFVKDFRVINLRIRTIMIQL